MGRDLKRLSRPEARKILARIEKDLARDAQGYPALKGEYAGLRKCRIGDYRVVFALLEDQVLVLRIRHRKEVYR